MAKKADKTEKITMIDEEKPETHLKETADTLGASGEAIREVSILIKSKQPIIYIHSNESEDRMLRILNEICSGENNQVKNARTLFVWDLVNGLTTREFYSNSSKIKEASKDKDGTKSDDSAPTITNTNDPASVLDHIIASNDESAACYVLCDFHHYLDNPGIIRRLKNFSENTAQKQHKNIILLSPDNLGMPRDGKVIPPELDNILYLIDWPIPDEVTLKKVFEEEIISVANGLIKKTNKHFENKGEPQKALIENNEKSVDDLVKASKGLTINEAKTAAWRSLVETFTITPAKILAAKRQIVKKKGLVDYVEPSGETIDDLGGLKNLKAWLKDRRPILSDDARDFGCDLPNGVLLTGPWGGGKSATAKAIINEWGLPGIRIDAAKLFDSFVGASERNCAEALKLAESIAPCICWFDEIENLFSGSESSSQSDGGTTSRVLGIISTWMAEHKGMVFNIFTANDISKLPPKLLRKGRIDEIFIVDLPVEEERKEIFKIHIDKRRINNYSKKIDLNILASESKMFSGAEIKEAVNTGFIAAFNGGKREVKTEDILNAIRSTVPISCTMKEQLVKMRDWQEGRAVRASSIKPEEIIDIADYRKKQKNKTKESDLDPVEMLGL